MINILKKIRHFILYYFYYYRNMKVNFFQYKKLSEDFPIFSINPHSGIIGNKCFGNIYAVRRALGGEFEKNCMIEHGMYFGKYVIENECHIPGLKTIYTFGPYRKKALEDNGIDHVNIVEVGPYILSVKNFCSQEFLAKTKRDYGKILLVFPYHSATEIVTDYKYEDFINEIKKIKKQFNIDSVFISMFWLDIKRNNHLIYEKEGFKIVCSGTRNEPHFLRRLKDLLELSDLTMSNDIGTHIGYSICLGTPHYFYRQKIEIKEYLGEGKGIEFADERMNIIEEERALFSSLFGTASLEISNDQKRIVEYYWGKKYSNNDDKKLY